MNREILFRGKRTDNGEWDITGVDFCEVAPSTLCQYTGLTDKRGKKIWENDILRLNLSKVGRVDFNETHLAYTILNYWKVAIKWLY